MNGPPEPKKGPLQRCNAEEGKNEGFSQHELTEFKESELSVSGQGGLKGAKIANRGGSASGFGLQPGLAPLGAALAAADPLKTASALVSSAYRQKNSSEKGSEAFRLDVYPSGVIMRRTKRFDIKPPVGLKRGNVTEFSCEAARRLREFCVTMEIRGMELHAFTLTTHHPFPPSEFRAIRKRFLERVRERGWGGIWRVELQPRIYAKVSAGRGVPHIHCALWLPPGLKNAFGTVRDQWLQCSGESRDRDARKYAVMGKRIQSHGWAVYMALHDGKKKGAQLGWLGRQWGIWNRELFTLREAEVSRELPVGQEIAVRRFLRRLMRSKGSRAKIGNRGFLRCMSGDVMARYLAGLDSGRVAHVSWREALAPF
jgi:hypothetical protein